MRGMALAGLLAAAALAVAPARAAPVDVELLHSYIGSWQGTGVLTGAQSETVRCKLDLTPGNDDKVNYAGRCAIAGSPLSVRGTLAYIEGARRFEAAMTSGIDFSPENAIGQRSGDGVVFNMRERQTDDEGNDVTITAQIALQSGSIRVQFNVLYNDTGDVLNASVPFSR
jgi:hypothetical protein